MLLTGATGLIGSWVVRQWPRDGPTLIPVGSSDVDLLRSGAPSSLVADVKPTHVVHLAWSASGKVGYRHSPDNHRWLRATGELATATMSSGAQLWLTGTIVDTPGLDQAVLPDAYSASKAELRRTFADHISSKRVGLLRPAYVFDEAFGRPDVVAQARKAAKTGTPVSLRSPAARHDFVHAADVGTAVIVAVSEGLGGELAIGSGRLRRVAELVEALGARWELEAAAAHIVTHAESASDTTWLIERGWLPARTDEVFGTSRRVGEARRGER